MAATVDSTRCRQEELFILHSWFQHQATTQYITIWPALWSHQDIFFCMLETGFFPVPDDCVSK